MNNFRDRLMRLEDNISPHPPRNVVINVITEGDDDVQPCDGSDVDWNSIPPMPSGDRIHVHFHDEEHKGLPKQESHSGNGNSNGTGKSGNQAR